MKRSVLCLGEILSDLIADQPGQTLGQVQSWTPYPGGAPANVACGLVKLGTPASFIGCVGVDDLGVSLVELLRSQGVGLRGVLRHPQAPTRQVYVLRTGTGDRIFAGFSHPDTAIFADAHLQADRLPQDLFGQAIFLVMGTLGLATADTRGAMQRALQLARLHDVPVVIDVNWRPMFWPNPSIAPGAIHGLLTQANWLKVSREEAEWLFETPDPAHIAEQLEGITGVLVTAGEDGCRYWISGHTGHVPAFQIEVEDTTGAGDSFLAGFLHQLAQHRPEELQDRDTIQTMVRYASATGALTTLRPGAIAAQPTAVEVDAFLYMQDNAQG